jgi:hypothetical protein
LALYYLKTEIDNMLSGLGGGGTGDYYTKEEIDLMFSYIGGGG